MSNTHNLDSNGEIALVTGASRGIGAEIAKTLASKGYRVVVNYAHDDGIADAVVSALAESGAKVLATKADVSDSSQVKAMFDQIEQTWGPLDVVINNAGILSTTRFADASDEEYQQVFSVNTRGVFNTLRECATRLNQGGRIVNFSSTTLAMNMAGYGIYNGTKAAVEAFSKVFAKEMRGRNIRVNTLAPGPVATELFMQGKTEQQIEHFAKLAPLERMGEVQDIAKVVAFLLTPDAAWINGQTLRVNGGLA